MTYDNIVTGAVAPFNNPHHGQYLKPLLNGKKLLSISKLLVNGKLGNSFLGKRNVLNGFHEQQCQKIASSTTTYILYK